MNAAPEFDHRIDPLAWQQQDACVDELDRQPVAKLLARRLLEQGGVVGVYGTWGSGKSYVLDLTIREMFEQKPGLRPIVCYFQPWRYEPDSSLAPGLILALRSVNRQFPGDNPPISDPEFQEVSRICTRLWRLMRRAVAPLKPLAQAVSALPSGAFPHQEYALAAASVITAVPDAEQADHADHADHAEQADQAELPAAWDPAAIRKEMTELIAQLRLQAQKSEGHPLEHYRVVVVIDDLDRCAPDLMVDMLNWLKVHLSVDQCSYLLALDHGAAARAIVGRYRDYLGDADVAYGYRYLEKIVDFEVELGRSDLVERMAVKSAVREASSPEEQRATTLEEIVEHALQRQGVRSTEIRQLMQLPTLQSPRTMLKVVTRFREALNVVREQQRALLAGRSDGAQLPVDYPFWLLLLVAMYYRLAPEYMEAFCEGRTPLRDAVGVPGVVRVPEPVREFSEFVQSVMRSGDPASQAPGGKALTELYSVVRGLAPRLTGQCLSRALNGEPHVGRGERHVRVQHAERRERVDDRVDDGGRRPDGGGLADALGADRVVR